jgi:hypothetical protein
MASLMVVVKLWLRPQLQNQEGTVSGATDWTVR